MMSDLVNLVLAGVAVSAKFISQMTDVEALMAAKVRRVQRPVVSWKLSLTIGLRLTRRQNY